jgi:hypothetical protein
VCLDNGICASARSFLEWPNRFSRATLEEQPNTENVQHPRLMRMIRQQSKGDPYRLLGVPLVQRHACAL